MEPFVVARAFPRVISGGSSPSTRWKARATAKHQTSLEHIRAQTGTCSTISNPYPSRPTTFRVLFESNLILARPSAARIWAPMP
jgi:hypothetical protein